MGHGLPCVNPSSPTCAITRQHIAQPLVAHHRFTVATPDLVRLSAQAALGGAGSREATLAVTSALVSSCAPTQSRMFTCASAPTDPYESRNLLR
jgi:hypothetical protein